MIKVTALAVFEERQFGARATQRRQAILRVAAEMFLHHGYAATSMSAIAAAVGGSKATLYTYFPSKEALFIALIGHESGVTADELFALPTVDGAVDVGLRDFGERFLRVLLTDRVVQLYRILIAEAARFPELIHAFYEIGPRRGISRLSEFLHQHMEAGHLRRVDPDQAARQFIGMIQWAADRTRLFNQQPPLDAIEQKTIVAGAIATFLYGVGAPALTSTHSEQAESGSTR